MKKFLLPFIVLVMAFSVSCDDAGDDSSNDDATYVIQFRQGFQPDTSYDGVSDTMISSVDTNTGTNYGTNAKMFVWTHPDWEWRALVKFNIAGYVPPSAVITRAVLSFYCDSISGPVRINVHTFIISWYEGTATWIHSGGQAWTGGEGDYDEKPIASKRVTDSGASLQEVSFNLDPGAVQEWIDNPWSNQGLVLIAVNETTNFKGVDFNSNDSIYDYLVPVLTIEYRL